MGNPLWQWTWDKAVTSHHPRSHFLITRLFWEVDASKYKQLFLWGAFGSHCFVAQRAAQVRRWIRWFHSCRNYLRIHLRADQPTVREFLKETFPGQWIGRGSATSPSPIFWPPRNRDLTTLDNYLWRIIKDEVAVRHCYTNAQLRAAITYTLPPLTSHIP